MRYALLPVAVLTLVIATLGGLNRMGAGWGFVPASWQVTHGLLMVNGFLGAVISLERAVALQRRRWYLAPAAAVLGVVALLAGQPTTALLLMTGCSLLYVAITVALMRIHLAVDTALLFAGAVAWATGNLLLAAGRTIPEIYGWWMLFLVLTIVGERLEINRMLRLTRRQYGLLFGALAAVTGATAAGLWAPVGAARVAGAGMVAIGLWLLRYDIARRRLRAGGRTAYIAVGLLGGYLWLVVSGALLALVPGWWAGPLYDVVLHTFFVGFVLSMIFAHAPVIFPALLQMELRDSGWWYGPLAMLHLSLLLRVGGDLLSHQPLRLAGGIGNGLALLAFLMVVVGSLRPRQGYAAAARKNAQKPGESGG
jgi:hypothetical protein